VILPTDVLRYIGEYQLSNTKEVILEQKNQLFNYLSDRLKICKQRISEKLEEVYEREDRHNSREYSVYLRRLYWMFLVVHNELIYMHRNKKKHTIEDYIFLTSKKKLSERFNNGEMGIFGAFKYMLSFKLCTKVGFHPRATVIKSKNTFS